MAKKKQPEVRPYSKHVPSTNIKRTHWSRTGGGIGDDSMEKGAQFDADGCGVGGPVYNCSSDPNEQVESSLGKHKGAEVEE